MPWLRREERKAFATWRIFVLKTKAAEENRANVAQAVHEALASGLETRTRNLLSARSAELKEREGGGRRLFQRRVVVRRN